MVGESIRLYLLEIGKLPRLVAEEERAAIAAVQRSRGRFRLNALENEFVLRSAIERLAAVCEGREAFHQVVEVSATLPTCQRKRILDDIARRLPLVKRALYSARARLPRGHGGGDTRPAAASGLAAAGAAAVRGGTAHRAIGRAERVPAGSLGLPGRPVPPRAADPGRVGNESARGRPRAHLDIEARRASKESARDNRRPPPPP